MNSELQKNLELTREVLERAEKYSHAAGVLSFDLETVCPHDAMEKQGETGAFLRNEAFKLMKDPKLLDAAEYLYEHRFGSGTKEAPGEDGLDEMDCLFAEYFHRDQQKVRHVTPEIQHEWAKIENKAYIDWLRAKRQDDYSVFAPSLAKIRDIGLEAVKLSELRFENEYDAMLDDYERGMCTKDLDETFGRCKERLLPFLQKIRESGKKIRTDFLSRPVSDHAQQDMANYLLDTIHYDKNRGALATTEHPFTSDIAKDDIRVTTNYRPNAFLSNIYSVVHEGGHAIFGQLQPRVSYDHFLDNRMTMGMHESVSRFYENRIGRSREFLSLIYDRTREIFPDVMGDVSEEELYEAVNIVEPSLIRIEADEFTYTLHIIIRYELEKEIVSGRLSIEDLPEAWNRKYEEYLGVRPERVRDGVLQDVHWSFGFGYFPTYALGNMYNAMYYNRMKQEIDLAGAIRGGDFGTINGWMAEHVFAHANYTEPKVWIREITGRDFTPDDFLNYLEEKYGELYGIE